MAGLPTKFVAARLLAASGFFEKSAKMLGFLR
jgi:hypothetical protein